MQHRFSASFVAMFRNKLHLFSARFTAAEQNCLWQRKSAKSGLVLLRVAMLVHEDC